jgi:hypothetical protein
MSFEQPNKEIKATSEDLKLENSSNDLEMKEADVLSEEELTPEEVREIMETSEKEIELLDILEKWTAESITEMKQRAKHFGIDESIVNEIKDDIKQSLERDFYRIMTEEGVEELKKSSLNIASKLAEKENK